MNTIIKRLNHNSLKELHAIIVIPCLNEEFNIIDTCATLGFGSGIEKTPSNTNLILVNNNSVDNTQALLEDIQSGSPINTVHVTFEPEIGYIPPRHHGNLLAKKIAESLSLKIEEILIIQADADTNYSENYVDIIRMHSAELGENVLFEACSDYPPSFKEKFLCYVDLCKQLDDSFREIFSLCSDYIVDDKAAAYRLSDYFKWGGFKREYLNTSDEIHAETTRLFMKAQPFGATKVYVENAFLYHSARKIYQKPTLHLATAGFPRELSWLKKWNLMYRENLDLQYICDNLTAPTILQIIITRKIHLLGLFFFLPVHIDSTLNKKISPEIADFAGFVLKDLPWRNDYELRKTPGLFLKDIFDLIEKKGETILSELTKFQLK